MMLSRYHEVLARPQVLPVFVTGVLCRLPASAATVAITLFVVAGRGGNYAQAGLVAAAMTVGVAVGSPWRGRQLDRLGLRRTLTPSILVEGAVWFAFPFLSYPLMLPAALIGGLMSVPVYSVIRQSLSVLAEPRQQRTVFSLDSIATELSYLVGPATAAALSATWSATGTILVVGAATVVAGVGLMILNPRLGVAPAPAAPPSGAGGVGGASGRETAEMVGRADGWSARGGAAREVVSAPLAAVLAATVVALAVIGAVDVSVVAFTRAHDQSGLTWLVLAAWSLSSLTGVLVFGGSTRNVSVQAILLGMCALAVPVGLAPNAWWLALFIIPTGLLGAPMIAATGTQVSRLVPEHRRGEAMGWFGSATTVGLGVGTPFAGWAIDTAGPWAGFAVPGAIGALVALIALLLIRLAIDRPAPLDELTASGENIPGAGAQSGVSPTLRQSTEV